MFRSHLRIWELDTSASLCQICCLNTTGLLTSAEQCNFQQLGQCWVPQTAYREIKIPALITKCIWIHETAIKLLWFLFALLAVITSQFLKNIHLLFPSYVCAVGFYPRRILAPSYKSLNPENFKRNTYSFLTSLGLTLTLQLNCVFSVFPHCLRENVFSSLVYNEN